MNDDFPDIPLEAASYYAALSILVGEISEDWAVVLRLSEDDIEDISWLVFPYEGDISQCDDLFEAAEGNDDKLLLKLRAGILFAYPTDTSFLSSWMASKLRNKPELAGRII